MSQGREKSRCDPAPPSPTRMQAGPPQLLLPSQQILPQLQQEILGEGQVGVTYQGPLSGQLRRARLPWNTESVVSHTMTP